jgi:hypothetical protein
MNKAPASWHTLLEGLRFVWSRPIVLGAISLDLFAVLFGGATALLPAYAHDVLHAGPTGLGLLRTAPGAGAALCSIALAFFPITRRVGAWMFGGVAVFGAATVVLGLTTTSFPSRWSPVPAGRRRHGQRLRAPPAGAVRNAGRDPRPRQRRQRGLHRRLQRTGRIRVGPDRRLVRPGARDLFGGAATLVVTGAWMKLFPVLSRMDRFPHDENK